MAALSVAMLNIDIYVVYNLFLQLDLTALQVILFLFVYYPILLSNYSAGVFVHTEILTSFSHETRVMMSSYLLQCYYDSYRVRFYCFFMA